MDAKEPTVEIIVAGKRATYPLKNVQRVAGANLRALREDYDRLTQLNCSANELARADKLKPKIAFSVELLKHLGIEKP